MRNKPRKHDSSEPVPHCGRLPALPRMAFRHTDYNAMREELRTRWKVKDSYAANRVDDLVFQRWKMGRIEEACVARVVRILPEAEGLPRRALDIAELEASASDPAVRHCFRLAQRYEQEIGRIERDLPQICDPGLVARVDGGGPRYREVMPVLWAESAFALRLDVDQGEILQSRHAVTVLNAARYTGKTTVLALRAIYESEHGEGSGEIACLSATGELLDRVRELARAGGFGLARITGTLTAAATLVLVDDAADLDAGPVYPAGATVVLAATPRGAGGYFHAQWKNRRNRRVQTLGEGCLHIPESVLGAAREELSRSGFQQEFECRFLAQAAPRCRLLAFAQ